MATKQRGGGRLDATLQGFGPAIQWLSTVGGVSQRRLAGLFGTSPKNIAVIKYRTKRKKALPNPWADSSVEPGTDEFKRQLGIRPEQLEDLESDGKIQELEVAVDHCFEIHRGGNTYAAGIKALLDFKPFVGRPSRLEYRRLKARILRHLAWFYSHSGFSQSALIHERMAYALYLDAYHEATKSGEARDSVDMAAMADCARLMAHTHSLGGDPRESLAALQLVERTIDKLNGHLDADFFRQRGVAHFQLGDNASAESDFETSMHRLEESGEAGSLANVLHHGTRHTVLLYKPRWDESQEVLAEVKKAFGTGTMHFSVSTNWTVACGLKTRDPKIAQVALKLLHENAAAAQQFGHQLTIAKLLEITPELGLSPGLLPIWIPKALYYNAFRQT